MDEMCVDCGDMPPALPLAVCYSCRDAVRESVDAIVYWRNEMLDPPVRSRNRGSSPGTSSEGPTWPDDNPRLGTPVKNLPVNDRVLTLRTQIRDVLWSWACVYVEQIAPGSVLYPGGDADEYAGYLRQGERLLLAGDGAADYAREMQRLAHEAQRTAAPGQREGRIIGVHRGPDCDNGCVWATSIIGLARCTSCGDSWSMQDWYTDNPPSADDLLLDDEVVEEIRMSGHLVTIAAVRKYRFRQQLPAAHGVTKYGRVATRRGDVQKFVADKWPQGLAG